MMSGASGVRFWAGTMLLLKLYPARIVRDSGPTGCGLPVRFRGSNAVPTAMTAWSCQFNASGNATLANCGDPAAIAFRGFDPLTVTVLTADQWIQLTSSARRKVY